MDLFLVNSPRNSKISPLTLGIAGAALLGVWILSKMVNTNDDDSDLGDGEDKQVSKPAGIYNEGNTCFVNSLLQSLSSLQSFQQLLRQTAKNFRGQLIPHQRLIIQLQYVLSQINNGGESISVGGLLAIIEEIKEGLINLEQQDAHEFYTAIISCVDQTLNKQKRLDLSASVKEDEEESQFENPMIGYIKSSTICTTCRCETSIKIDPFYDLSLDISKAYVFDVPSALLEFQRQEKIENWICSNCSIKAHCKKLRKAITMLQGQNKQKLAFIAEAVIEFMEDDGMEQNEIREVNFKLEDFGRKFIQEYQEMAGDPQRQLVFVELQGIQSSILRKTVITKYPKILVMHFKQLIINPYTGQPVLLKKQIGFDQTLYIKAKNRQVGYQLTGLLTHIGTENFGHYLSFRRKNKESNQWYVMNDSSSQKASWDLVQRSKAYMLFYQAI